MFNNKCPIFSDRGTYKILNNMLALQQNNKLEDHQDQHALEGVRIVDLKADISGDDPVDVEDHLLKSPVIPKEIYPLLPSILKDGSEIFSSSREKDVFLTSSLSILSGCFPNVSGRYDQKKVHPNLFSMVIAPPASGKSAMISAKELGLGIHNALKESIILTTDPNSPSLGKFLFMPGNISAAGMIAMLRDNIGIGIICETETDTLTNAIKQDWGNFSDMLRKAFQHEPISCARKKEVIEIPRPKVSVALTGTINQLQPFLKSIYDGLFSRFVFYIYRNTPRWRDPSAKSNFVYDSYMTGLQERIKSIYDFTKDQEYTFDLTVYQWTKLNTLYEERLRKTVAFKGEDTSATIFRLALIHFRIAMTLSILRFFEEKPCGNMIVCRDLDYSIAELLCELFLQHGMLVYSILTNGMDKGVQSNIEKFFSSLPVIPFKRKDAVAAGKILGIAERTVGKYLRLLKDTGFLKQDTLQGEYQKVME